MIHKIAKKKGRVEIRTIAVTAGNDLSITLHGGDSLHIGCVALSIPRPSLDDPDVVSSTTSVLNITGHKDEEVSKYMSSRLSSSLNKIVSVAGGIHIDDITEDEIDTVRDLVSEATEELLNILAV